MNQSFNFIDDSARIGSGTKIWHFCVILADVVIGIHCSIGSRTEIGRGTMIGQDTRIGSGVFLPPNSKIGREVFIGPGAIFCDDRSPRAGNNNYKAEPPVIEDRASIGAGVVVLPGVKIGHDSRIGAGAIVTKDVAPFALVRSEPARQVASGLEGLKLLRRESVQGYDASVR